jgi:hypothetical protein
MCTTRISSAGRDQRSCKTLSTLTCHFTKVFGTLLASTSQTRSYFRLLFIVRLMQRTWHLSGPAPTARKSGLPMKRLTRRFMPSILDVISCTSAQKRTPHTSEISVEPFPSLSKKNSPPCITLIKHGSRTNKPHHRDTQ